MNSLIGVVALLAFAWLVSSNRAVINWRTVGWAFALQAGIGGIALFSAWGQSALQFLSGRVASLLEYSQAGIAFMFGPLVASESNLGFIFAFSVLPVVIFFSALIAVL